MRLEGPCTRWKLVLRGWAVFPHFENQRCEKYVFCVKILVGNNQATTDKLSNKVK